MARRGEIVGAVDFGSREIRVLIARKDDDGSLQILGHGTASGRGCVSQGVIQDIDATQMALKRALADAEKEARVKVRSLFCGVNGRNVETFIREGNVKLEREIVEQTHMDEAIDIASRDILAPGKRIASSISAQEWYVDDLRVMAPAGIRGQVLKTRIHFARLPAVIEDNMITCVESQRCEVEDVIFTPLAAALGCLTPEDTELGIGILDIGRSTTGLAIYRDHRILGTHCFEWGGYHLTRDVAAGLQTSFEEANELILEYGIPIELVRADANGARDGGSHENLREERAARIKLKNAVHGAPTIVDRSELDVIVFERAKELMTKVRQHVHARGLMKHLVRGMVLTGGGAVIKNHVHLAEAVFQVPCRVGYPDRVEILPQAVAAPEFVVAVGIVRHAFAFREATRNGRIKVRGPLGSGLRRVTDWARKYFM